MTAEEKKVAIEELVRNEFADTLSREVNKQNKANFEIAKRELLYSIELGVNYQKRVVDIDIHKPITKLVSKINKIIEQ